MSRALRYGLVGGNPSDQRRQMDADDAAMRAADERTTQEWREEMGKKTKKTPYGAVKRPRNTKGIQSNLDSLGELLGDLADAVREAQAREQVVAGASAVDPKRFPSVAGGGQ